MSDQKIPQDQEDKKDETSQDQETKTDQTDKGGQPASESKDDDRIGRMEQLYARLKKKEKAMKELEEKMQRDQEELANKKLIEEKKFEELAAKLKAESEQKDKEIQELQSLNETINKYLEAEIENVPEEKRTAIPEHYTSQQKLDWIAANKHWLIEKKVSSSQELPKNKNLSEISILEKEIQEIKEKQKSLGISGTEELLLIEKARKLAELKSK